MRSILMITFIIIALVAELIATDKSIDVKNYISVIPFVMPSIRLPDFPDRDFNIKDFGAVGDGHTLNTDAINATILASSKTGGGRVIIPAGMWYTGPIILKENINLYIEKGAVVIFSGRFEDYPVIETSWEGLPMKRCISPIYGKDLENIAITGEGIVDGSGERWRPVLKWETTVLQWQELLKSGGAVKATNDSQIWWPSERSANGKQVVDSLKKQNSSMDEYSRAGEYLRPVLISFVNCRKVLLDGPTFKNSPAWNIHPLMCEDVVIRNIKVKNPWYSTNGDGLDLESCKNVFVYNCTFDVGDDAICLKSGRDAYGRKRGIPSENIVIRNCTVYNGHGGFVIGSEMSGGVRNIFVKDCVFLGTDLGLRFKSTRGRGGVVENIYVDGILMKDIKTEAIRFNTFYQGKAPVETDLFEVSENEIIPPVTEKTPKFKGIFISNVFCRNASRAVFIQGLPEMAIANVEMKDMYITAATGMIAIDTDNIKFQNVTVLPQHSPVISLINSRNIEFNNVNFPPKMETLIKISGQKTHNIRFKNNEVSKLKERIKLSKDLTPDIIVLE